MVRSSALACTLLVIGCKASLTADEQMNAELYGKTTVEEPGSEPSEQERALSAQQMGAARQASFMEEPGSAPDSVLLGARHDFTVKDSSGAIACRCVSVLLGLPTSGKLAWRGEIPRIKPETQLVLGLIPEAGECPGAPKGSQGASYWGYRVVGNDVVVLLEEWKPSLPRTLGAIIPKPPSGGQVYVAPVSSRLPYGAPTSGATGQCAAGNPGARRSEPFSPAELPGAARSEPAEAGTSD